MNPTEHTTKTPFAMTGIFALLCGFLHISGTGAPSPRPGAAAGRVAIAMCLLLTAGGLMATSASALGASYAYHEPRLTGFTASRQVAFGPDGYVYVADQGAKEVKIYKEESGTYVPQTPVKGSGLGGQRIEGVAVDQSNGDLYIHEFAVVSIYNASGTEKLGEITEASGEEFSLVPPGGIAIDETNHVLYVIEKENEREERVVDKFSTDPEACTVTEATCIATNESYESQLTGSSCPSGEFGELGSVAVDQSTGDAYVTSGEAVDKFSSSGTCLSEIVEGPPGEKLIGEEGTLDSVAVDAAGNLFVASDVAFNFDSKTEYEPTVFILDSAGNYIESVNGSEVPALEAGNQRGRILQQRRHLKQRHWTSRCSRLTR